MLPANVIPMPGARKHRRRCPALRPCDDAPDGVARFSDALRKRYEAQAAERLIEAGVRQTPELLILLAMFEQLDHEQRRAAQCRIASYCKDPDTADVALAALTLLGR